MALIFNGGDRRALVTDDTALNVLGAVSITAWLKTFSTSLNHCILSKERTTSRDMPYEFRTIAAGQQLDFIRAGNAQSWPGQTSSAAISANVWHHVAVTCSSGGATPTVKFYIDGALDNTLNPGTQPTVTTTTQPAYIGNRLGGLAANCALAHIGLYDKELNFNEVLATRALGRIESPDLILYCPLWGAAAEAPLVTGASQSVLVSGSTYIAAVAPYVLWLVASNATGQGRGILSSIADANTCLLWALKPATAGAVISLRGNGTVYTSASTASATFDKPAGTAATDILVAYISTNLGSGTTITPPAGWTAVGTASNSTFVKAALYWALGNVASTTFTFTAGTAVVAFIGGFINVHNTTPSDATAAAGTNSSNAVVAFNQITPASAGAMLTGLGAVRSLTGNPSFSLIWPQEADLSGARRLTNNSGATITGGPPYVRQYGSLALPLGLWAASSGGTSVTADFILTLEAQAGLVGDKTANAEYLVPLDADKAANLGWLLALQTDKDVLLEFLAGLFTDKTVTLESGLAAIKDAAGNVEWLVPLADDDEMPCEYGVALQTDKTISLEILGVPVVEKDFILTFEFLTGFVDDNVSAIEFLSPLVDDDVITFEFGIALTDDNAASLEFKAALFDDSAAGLEILNSLIKDGILPFAFGVAFAKDFIFNFEITGGTGVLRDYIPNLEWKVSVTQDRIPNLEFKTPLSQDGLPAFEWLAPLSKDSVVNFEFTANTVDNALGFVLEWLAQLAVDKIMLWENFPVGNPVGAEKINLYGGNARKAAYIDRPFIRTAGEEK